MNKQSEYKRHRGLSFKDNLQRLLSKKPGVALKNNSCESGKHNMGERENSFRSTSSSYIEDGKNITTHQNVIRRVRSEGDISPEVSKSNFASLAPESKASSSDCKPFPARSDSLQYASAYGDQASGSNIHIQPPTEDDGTTLPHLAIHNYIVYLETRIADLDKSQHAYAESAAERQIPDPFNSPAASSTAGLNHQESANNGYRSSHAKGGTSLPQTKGSRTGSPSPLAPESENVPRGILDTFIENLMRNGHVTARDHRDGLSTSGHQNEEDGPDNQLSYVRQTLELFIRENQVLDHSTTMALADFIMGYVDAFTYDRGQKKEKVKQQRELLKAQKERLDRAIATAMDADVVLKEEEMGLEEDQKGFMRGCLQLNEIMDGECSAA